MDSATWLLIENWTTFAFLLLAFTGGTVLGWLYGRGTRPDPWYKID